MLDDGVCTEVSVMMSTNLLQHEVHLVEQHIAEQHAAKQHKVTRVRQHMAKHLEATRAGQHVAERHKATHAKQRATMRATQHRATRGQQNKTGHEAKVERNKVARRKDAVYTPVEMQALMGLGINVGNRFDLWNEAKWAAGTLPKAVAEDVFETFASKGFTNARIPVCWHFKTDEASPYDIDSAFLDDVEEMVDWSLDQGLVTILDTHHEEWLDDEDEFSEGLERFKAIWTQIAERFKDKGHALVFEIFNEPHNINVDQLNEMYDAVLPIIRDANPTRIVLLQGLSYGNPKWIVSNPTGLTLPADDYIMLAVHRYDPWSYAGNSPTKTSWTYDEDFSTMTAWMDDLDAWSTTYGVPIYYGEFGVTNDQTAATGRDEWFTYHASEIASRGWGASVWNDGSGHLIMEYDTLTWDDDILWDLGKSNRCCWGGSSTCGTVTTCYDTTEKSWCAASEDNCVNSCSGTWCTNEENLLSA